MSKNTNRAPHGAGIAFFDLDKTVISVNSGYGWLRREWREKRMPPHKLFQGVWGLLKYSLGNADMKHVIEGAIQDYAGQPTADLRTRTEQFFEEEIRGYIRADALKAIQHHRDLGHLCVLLTTSSHFMAGCVVNHLGLDDAICTRLESGMDGRLTGRAMNGACYGDEKRVRAKAMAEDHDVPLAQCWFYTDSFSDIEALKAVGHPVIVSPDPRLRRWAKKCGWPIEMWE